MEEEKNILLIVDGVPKVNFSVTKNNTVADLKNILKQFSSKGAEKVIFFINDETQVPVFDSNQYDKLSLASVWTKMTKPQINLLTSKLFVAPLNLVVSEEQHLSNKENREVALSGIKDVDFIIMQSLSDQELGNFCRVNKEARKLCTDDTFWRNRTMKRFSSVIPQETLTKNKEANFKTWREYYIDLVDFLEKIYMGFLIGLEIPGQRRKLMEKEYIIKESRDDLMILHDEVENNGEELNSLSNVKKILATDFVDPNIFFEYNYFFASNHHGTIFNSDNENNEDESGNDEDNELKRREKLEAVKLIGSDSRFRAARVLPLLIRNLSYLRDDEYEVYIKVLSPYFTKEMILDILYEKLEEGNLIVKLRELLLPLAVEKGATKKDINNLLKATFQHESDRDAKRYYKDAIGEIKQFLKKMK